MNRKKYMVLLLCIMLLISAFAVSAGAEEDLSELTATNCYQINDSQLVIEFNQPIAFSTTQEPFIAIRYVDANGILAWDGGADEGTPLQFPGSWEYVDDVHDRILWTLPENSFGGANTINDVISFAGELEKYAGYGVRFAIEEIKFDDSDIYTYTICNITAEENPDVELSATLCKPGWQDGLYMEIVENRDYEMPADEIQQGNAGDELGIIAAPSSSSSSSQNASQSQSAAVETQAPVQQAETGVPVWLTVVIALAAAAAGAVVSILIMRRK